MYISDGTETRTSAPLTTCLQPEDFAQHIADNFEDEILCLAPAEGSTPEAVQNKEAEAFPTLFPDGKNTYNQDRKQKLNFSQYVKCRLFSSHFKFPENIEYIFYLQYLKELKEVLSSAKISLRKGAHPGTGAISAGEMLQPQHLMKLVQKNDGYKYLTNVRGSAPYWEATMRDLCAMVRQLGIPTWFCSFSAADRRWPEIVKAILTLQGKDVPDEVDWTEHCQIINSNPVVAALMFDRRAHHLMTDLILADSHVIGEVTEFFYRIEFQQRGWPHIHALFWVNDAPKLSQSLTSRDPEVCAFIDKYVSCTLPDGDRESHLHEQVSSVQTHSKNHSKSCKKGRKTCRFNFPRPPSTRTFICRPSSPPEGVSDTAWKKEATLKMEKFWKVLNVDDNINHTAAELLDHADLTQTDLEDALCRLSTKTSIILKREPKECWINQYNANLLAAWNANLDIQYVVDAYSCIAYILSYISKKESEEGQLLKEAQREAREGNDGAITELRKIGRIFLTHREVSSMEAIWRATGMQLKRCSREVKWVPSEEQATR